MIKKLKKRPSTAKSEHRKLLYVISGVLVIVKKVLLNVNL